MQLPRPHTARAMCCVVALLVLAVVGGAPVEAQPPTTTAGSPSGSMKLVGYFTEWGIYRRDFQPKNLVTNGSAQKLTHLVVAFGSVAGGRCGRGDRYAETGKFYDAAHSVDGSTDSWAPGSLRGIFGQFRKLKAQHPGLKVLWSFGGRDGSAGFTDAAKAPDRFAASCFELLHDPQWAGLFDGIDINWQHPNGCDRTCDRSGPEAFGRVLRSLRRAFGGELVTAAVTANPIIQLTGGYGEAAKYVDWYALTAYDQYGPWTRHTPTAIHAPLYEYTGIPFVGFTARAAVGGYQRMGVPARKLVLGVPFHGRGWADPTRRLPGARANGPAAGPVEPGVEAAGVLLDRCPPAGVAGGSAYARCGDEWWTYDTPRTAAGKAEWARARGLGGVYAWDLSGDTASGALLSALDLSR